MGEAGLATRVLAGRFGSAWTYAGAVQDVGQLSTQSLIDDFRFYSIKPSTEIYGLVGSPIAHSVSPAMHNAAFAQLNRDAVYLPLPATDRDDFLAFARAMDVKGASVTIPFKVPLLDVVDDVDDATRRIGALNTIRMTGGRWLGRNTDAPGSSSRSTTWAFRCREREPRCWAPADRRAPWPSRWRRAARRRRSHGRNAERAAAVAAAVGASAGTWPPPPGSWDLLVNCTPIGMHPRVDETPLDAASLGEGVVYDLVYNPRVTRLLREAAAAGCRTIGGLDMLVAQAVEQFVWWTGAQPDVAAMRAAAVKRLSEFEDR